VVPELVDESRALYAALGVGYGLLAAAVFVGSGLRQRRLAAAIDRDDYEPASMTWVTGLTVAGAVLAVATLAIIIANA
jgi:drug/metabolite transporter (DMT)-like permease